MLQGGDFTKGKLRRIFLLAWIEGSFRRSIGNGTGGKSIYGEKFAGALSGYHPMVIRVHWFLIAHRMGTPI